MNRELNLEQIEENFPHTQKVNDLISNIHSIINYYEEDSYPFIDKYIANFRHKNIIEEKNFSSITYLKDVQDNISNSSINYKNIETNLNVNIEDFFMGITPIEEEQLKNLFVNENHDLGLNIIESDIDNIVYSDKFDAKISSLINFSKDNRKHEFLSICSVFIEEMPESDVLKLRSEINNNTFDPEKFIKMISDLSIIPFDISKDDKGHLKYAISPAGLPDAMFFKPGYASLAKLSVTTVAATLDKGTKVEGHSMLRHTVSSLSAKKEINTMLKDRDYNEAYDKIMMFYDHFSGNDNDFILDDDHQEILLSIYELNPNLLLKKSISREDWNDQIKPIIDELINHDGKLMNFSIDYINENLSSNEKHISEFGFANRFAEYRGHTSWEAYIKEKSSMDNFLNTMDGLNCKENKDKMVITKNDLKKLSRDLKSNNMDTFFVGNALFKTSNKTKYYETLKDNLDLTPTELRLGMNVAAYAAEYSGYLDFCHIEPGAGLEFVSSFNIRANTKKNDINGKKLSNSMNKIHQFMLNEYIFKSYDEIEDNCKKEDKYILDNIAKFKHSFYGSITNLMKNYGLDENDAFERYAKELGATLPKNFNAKDIIKKEKEIISNQLGSVSFYSHSFELLSSEIIIRDQRLKIKENNSKLKEKDSKLKEKDSKLKEKDVAFLNLALLLGTSVLDDLNDESLVSTYNNIVKHEPQLDGINTKITIELYENYFRKSESKTKVVNGDEFDKFLSSIDKNNGKKAKNKNNKKSP